jgi:hypothetical protein
MRIAKRRWLKEGVAGWFERDGNLTISFEHVYEHVQG